MRTHLCVKLIVFLSIVVLSSCSKDPIIDQPDVTPDNSSYVVTTVAGTGVAGQADGNSLVAQFDKPTSVAVDLEGNVYVVHYPYLTIRKISSIGVVTTLAGGTEGYADGTGSQAQFKRLTHIATDKLGNIFASDDTRIRKITADGIVSTVAGSETSGYADGVGTAALFKRVTGIVTDEAGNIFVSDNDVNIGGSGVRIRKVTPAGVVTTFVSNCPIADVITIDKTGNLYLGGLLDNIYKYTPSAVLTTVKDFASFNMGITGISSDSQGNIYYTRSSDANGSLNTIYKLTANGAVASYAGSESKGFKDGPVNEARFDNPVNLAVDNKGNIYVADAFNNRIRKISKQ